MLLAASGCRAEAPGRLSARVILQPHDTVQFSTDASAHSCSKRRGILFEGVVGGNGVLVWLRPDSLAGGDYRVLARGDSITPRGAVGAFRFLTKNSDRGVTLDSGMVTVSAASGRMSVGVRGSGLDPSAGQRAVLEASFAAVPGARDTVICRVQLEP